VFSARREHQMDILVPAGCSPSPGLFGRTKHCSSSENGSSSGSFGGAAFLMELEPFEKRLAKRLHLLD
jgi:hypothetical protein